MLDKQKIQDCEPVFSSVDGIFGSGDAGEEVKGEEEAQEGNAATLASRKIGRCPLPRTEIIVSLSCRFSQDLQEVLRDREAKFLSCEWERRRVPVLRTHVSPANLAGQFLVLPVQSCELRSGEEAMRCTL